MDDATRAADHEALVERCRSIVARSPEGVVFSHLTAARLHGLPLSYAMEADDRVHAMRPIGLRQPELPSVCGHRAFHPREVVVVDGLPVVALADTWVDVAELIGRGKPVGLDDMIVLGDAIATRLGTAHTLRERLELRVRPRGKVTALEALELIRVGSWSPRETLCRIMFVRCGLPEPELNQPIEGADGRPIAFGDLRWVKQRVIGEYQGVEFHDSPEQRAHDHRRQARVSRRGWRVSEIWQDDLADFPSRRALVLRFADLLGIDRADLDLSACEPRFFSQRALDAAEQRAHAWLARAGRWDR